MTSPAEQPDLEHSSRRLAGHLRWVPVLALAALVAMSCSSSSSSSKSGDSTPTSTGADLALIAGGPAPSIPKIGAVTTEFGTVAVTGQPLAKLGVAGTPDGAVGAKAPVAVGQRFDGKPITLSAAGKPTVILFLAHWCPHCNREVPALVQQWQQHGLPKGVQLLSVTTGSDENAPNWPPSQWIADEHWPVPVLADSQAEDAASAYGLPGYPFFVMLKPDGTVFFRHSGEWPVADFNQEVARLVAASQSSAAGSSTTSATS